MIRFDIITIFPEIFDSYFKESLIKRAVDNRLIKISVHNLRKWAKDKHHTTDDKPFGGGLGMVMKVEPIYKAVQFLKSRGPAKRAQSSKSKIVLFSPGARKFNQKMAYDWSQKYSNFIFVTGRYEGIDERVITALRRQPCAVEEISIGPYITTDGDVAAMVVVSALTRLIPGVIQEESLKEESFNPKLKTKNIKLVTKNYKLKTDLEYPHYTRPEVFKWRGKKYPVPKILLSGNHAEIEKWRNAKRGGVKMRKARR